MPTIQEEMSKVLTERSKPQEKPMTHPLAKNQFGVTNNVTRITFDYVKSNPGVTADQAADALNKQGFKATSVAAIKAGKKTDKTLVATDEGVKVATPHQEIKSTTITVKDIVEKMTMREARERYVELGKYFGV